MPIDWTIDAYRALSRALLDTGRPLLPVRDYLRQPDPGTIILRHDVDRFPGNAIRLAELESSLGIRSTYYVRVSRSAPDSDLLKRLASLGHEVGYHYEVLAKADGDVDVALTRFREELEALRRIVEVTTVAPHGSPLSRWDSLDLWKHVPRSNFELDGDAYLDIDFASALYLTDTGRTWREARSNLRDRPLGNNADRIDIDSTHDLIDALPSMQGFPICIQTHPERWSSTLPELFRSWTLDIGAAGAKLVIRTFGPTRVRH